MATAKVRGRNEKINAGARLAYLAYHCPVLIFGREAVKRGDYPRSSQGCIDFAAAEADTTPAQIAKHLSNCAVRLERRLEPDAKPTDPETACVFALRQGGSLDVAARLSGLPRTTVATAWIAADNGEDDEFGHKMLEAWAWAELDIAGDPQKEESRRRQHDMGAWSPQGDPDDRIENWNWYRENVTVIDNQMRFDDLLKEAENGEQQKVQEAGQRAS